MFGHIHRNNHQHPSFSLQKIKLNGNCLQIPKYYDIMRKRRREKEKERKRKLIVCNMNVGNKLYTISLRF